MVLPALIRMLRHTRISTYTDTHLNMSDLLGFLTFYFHVRTHVAAEATFDDEHFEELKSDDQEWGPCAAHANKSKNPFLKNA